MTWPYEIRHHEFSPGHPVPSVTLNEVQDKLVDLHKKKTLLVTRMHPYANQWILQDGVWVAQGKGPMCIYPDLPVDASMGEIMIKYYYTGIVSSSSDLKIEMYRYRPDIGVDSDPRIEMLHQEIVSGNPGWRTKVFRAMGVVENGEQILVRIWDAAPGDKVAGVLMSYYPVAY